MSDAPRAEIYASNTRAIANALPGLAKGMAEVPPSQLDQFETITIPQVNERELESFVAKIAKEVKGDALVLLGMSSQRMLELLREALAPSCALIVIEPTLQVAIRLLSQHDFSDVLSQPYVAPIFGARDRAILDQLVTLVNRWGIGEIQLIANPMRPLGDEVFELIADVIRDAVKAVELSNATGSKYSHQVLSSICNNLDAAASAFDITELSGRFTDVPAFCVAAGPSLDQDIELLKQVHEKGIVIAADAAVPMLMEAGIPPDIVTTIDVIDVKSVVFEKYYVKDALLVALLSAHPKIVTSWIGPRCFAVDNHPLSLWASDYIVPASHFGGLGNVSHLSFALARGLGCDPVVLVGTDMAIGRDDRIYASGAIHHPESEQKITDQDSSRFVEVTANDGQPVKTMTNMISYIHTFGDLALVGGRSYTTAHEGARIPNIPYRPLAELVDEFEQRDIQRPLFGEAPSRDDTVERRKVLAEKVEALGQEIAFYVDDAERFVERADLLRDKVADEDFDPSDAVRELHPLIESLSEHAAINDMLEPLQPAVIYELNRLSRETESMEDPVQRAQARITTLAGASAGALPLAKTLQRELEQAHGMLSQPYPAKKSTSDS